MNNVNNEIHWSDNGRDNLQCWPQGTRQPQYCTTSRQWRLLFFVIVSQWLTMHGPLYRKQLRLQQALEQNNVFGVILLYNFYNWFQQCILYFQSVWKQCCSSTIWGTVLKYKCIYNIVIPVVYNICTQCILQGPWVKSLRDNCPESKSAEWQYNHSVYKLSWFLQDGWMDGWTDKYGRGISM